MFQSDIYPPTTGLKPGTTASEWFGGKTAVPPKISLESIYEGGAPEEVPSDYKPPATATPIQSPPPTKTEAPKPTPAAAASPIKAQGPPRSVNDNKASLASQASKFADEEASSDDDASSFEDIPKPVERPSVAATKTEEKPASPVLAKSPEPAKPAATPVAAPSPAPAPVEPSVQPSQKAPVAATAPSQPSATASSVTGGIKEFLHDIRSTLEQQNKVLADQSDQIALLMRKVTTLESKVESSGGSSREKDERIRQLELELEEARS